MANNGLAWQVMNIPFGAGLAQKADDRSRPMPYLTIGKDVQFEEIGGVQTRLPYGAPESSIFGGGTIANARRIVSNGIERVLFTNDSVYSWNAQLSKWVLRGTHLAVAVDEAARFVTTGDQIDGDRAELAGTVVWAWTEGTQVYAAAMDKTTGSVLVSPTAVSTAIGRPRLVALATKILFFVESTATEITVRAIDPAAPGTAIAGAGTVVLTTNANLFYDVVRAGTQDLVVGAIRRVTTTSYTVFTCTPGLVVTTSTKARTADGPIAVATIADGTQTQIVRGNGTNIQGDLLTTSTLADVFTGQAIGTAAGTPVNQIAVEFASTTAFAFWSFQETSGAGSTSFGIKKNTVTTANVVGTQSTMVLRLGVASRAFLRSGRVFVWGAFASDSTSFGTGSPLGIRAQLQNSYFLYRDDGLLVSKSAFQIAGGFAASTGRLPGVVGTGEVFSWAGTWRRVIDLSADHTGYAERSLRDITFTFDSNRARRVARLGQTLYIGGGIPLAYDGVQLAEVGFLVYPWAFATQDSGVAGNLSIGTYSWKSTLRWQNAAGERERSTTATGEKLTFAAAHFMIATIFNLFVTLKLSPRPPNTEIWRTLVNTSEDSDYRLVTGQDPNTVVGDNCYLPNDPTTAGPVFNDNLSDVNLANREANPENGDVLESLAPPAAHIIIATETRLFLADIAGDPDRVWYSRERGDAEVASFHDELTIDVPPPGGSITSIAFLDETLIVFRQTAVYSLPGQGLDNLSRGQQFGPARSLSQDIGATAHEAVALTPLGLVFKSKKGWQLLEHGGSIRFIGGAVSDYDAETILSIDVVESQYQVRILSASRLIVWDYRGAVDANAPGGLGQWFEWTITDGIHSCMFGGNHVYLTATGPRTQGTSYSGLTYGMDVELLLQLADLQGAAACRKIQLLGEYRSAFLARIRIAYNYSQSYTDDKPWTPSPTTVGGPLQVRHSPKRPKCEALRVRITAVTEQSRASLATSEMDPAVATSGAIWSAELLAAASLPGEAGNAVALEIVFEAGATQLIDVRDHFTFASGIWAPALNTIGVRIVGVIATPPTIGAIEAAIAAGTAIATIGTPDVAPTKTLNVAAMAGLTTLRDFGSGAYGSPTGEALKLTGLGLEVGLEPGLFRRLPGAQQQ